MQIAKLCLRVPTDVRRQLKIVAAERSTSVKALVLAAISRDLKITDPDLDLAAIRLPDDFIRSCKRAAR